MRLALATGTLLVAFGLPGVAVSQDVVNVEFDSGAEGESIDGKITGTAHIDYRFPAEKGQSLEVLLEGDETTYFNLLPPDETADAIFNGSTGGDKYRGTLPDTGTYTVRVYQLGQAATGSQPTRFTLELDVD